MIASPTILTPRGERAVSIEFGKSGDDRAMKSWRASAGHSRPDLAGDAIEFATLAGKRWRYYLRRGEAVDSLADLRSRVQRQPGIELGFLLIARPRWKPAPAVLGLAWCRRTWCHHIVLDFLAIHPATNDPDGGYKGMGGAMLRGVATVAREIDCPLVWGEATATSARFYEKMLGGEIIQDHFFIRSQQLASLSAAITIKPDRPTS